MPNTIAVSPTVTKSSGNWFGFAWKGFAWALLLGSVIYYVRRDALTASIETMEQRIRTREFGMFQQKYVSRVAELNRILDRARLENVDVTSDDRLLTEVAREVLARAAWI